MGGFSQGTCFTSKLEFLQGAEAAGIQDISANWEEWISEKYHREKSSVCWIQWLEKAFLEVLEPIWNYAIDLFAIVIHDEIFKTDIYYMLLFGE